MVNQQHPWWWSGSACLAALMWCSFVALCLGTSFGFVELSNQVGGLAALLFVVAFLASALASRGMK